jgi:hypothetical protein
MKVASARLASNAIGLAPPRQQRDEIDVKILPEFKLIVS